MARRLAASEAAADLRAVQYLPVSRPGPSGPWHGAVPAAAVRAADAWRGDAGHRHADLCRDLHHHRVSAGLVPRAGAAVRGADGAVADLAPVRTVARPAVGRCRLPGGGGVSFAGGDRDRRRRGLLGVEPIRPA